MLASVFMRVGVLFGADLRLDGVAGRVQHPGEVCVIGFSHRHRAVGWKLCVRPCLCNALAPLTPPHRGRALCHDALSIRRRPTGRGLPAGRWLGATFGRKLEKGKPIHHHVPPRRATSASPGVTCLSTPAISLLARRMERGGGGWYWFSCSTLAA